MIKQIAQLNPSGGVPELEIQFGYANTGICRVFRWDADRPVAIGQPGDTRISVGLPADRLDGVTVSYEAIVQSPRSSAAEPYAVTILVRQDGEIVPGGGISEKG